MKNASGMRHANYLFGHFPTFSSRRSGVELSTLSTTPKLTSLPEALEPRQKSVTDVGLDYAACTKPVFGSGDRPRGPPATTGPLENPKPQMGYFSGSITGVAASFGMLSVRRN